MQIENPLSVLWWETSNPDDVHGSAIEDFDIIRNRNDRTDRFQTYEKVYRNEDITESETLQAELHTFGMALTEYTRSAHNLIAQVTDNIVSRIVRTKPRSVYSVHGGNWSLRRSARLQQKWVDSVAHAKFFPRYARTQVLNGVLLGRGHTMVYSRHGYNDVDCMHIHPADVLVDPTQSTLGHITRMYHRRWISKDQARRDFHDAPAKFIEDASVISEGDFLSRGDHHKGAPILDTIEVVEAWHLPSGPGADDGKYICFTSAGLLYQKKWIRDDFPIMTYQWKHRPGDFFHGLSVPEEIMGIHLDTNFTLQQVHEGIEVSGFPKWMVPMSANVSRDEIDDLPGGAIHFSGNVPPQFVQGQQVSFDLVQYSQEQEARAYRRLGLDSSTPNAPSPGLETGRAVRMDFDARSMAFVSALQNWENLYEDFGYKAVAAGKQCWERDKKFSVVVPKNKWTVEDVPWKDVELGDDAKFTIRVQVGSQLSQHPAGRIDDVQNLVNMGAVTEQAEKRALADLADLEHSNSKATAALNAIESMCEDMLDEGKQHYPEPYDDLDLCMSTANAEYLKARTCGAPEERLQIMRNFLDRCTTLIQKREVARAAQQQSVVMGPATPPVPDALGQNPAAIQGDVQ